MVEEVEEIKIDRKKFLESLVFDGKVFVKVHTVSSNKELFGFFESNTKKMIKLPSEIREVEKYNSECLPANSFLAYDRSSILDYLSLERISRLEKQCSQKGKASLINMYSRLQLCERGILKLADFEVVIIIDSRRRIEGELVYACTIDEINNGKKYLEIYEKTNVRGLLD